MGRRNLLNYRNSKARFGLTVVSFPISLMYIINMQRYFKPLRYFAHFKYLVSHAPLALTGIVMCAYHHASYHVVLQGETVLLS